MNNNILVIGNGFDLAHGRKTKYSHFLEWICEPNHIIKSEHRELLSDIAFPGHEDSSLVHFLITVFGNKKKINRWIDLEQELQSFIHNTDELIDRLNEEMRGFSVEPFLIRLKNSTASELFLIRQLISIIYMDGPNYALKKEYIDVWGKIDKKKVFETIHNELVDLCKMLEFYLVYVEPLLRGEIKQLDVIKQIDPAYVISFNYTDTIQKYYNIPDDRICYIHGKLNENNLVLGYDDSDGGLEDLEFKKYYQRLIYTTDSIDGHFFSQTDDFGDRIQNTIYFYGHSLDMSDEDIIKELFSKGNQVFIYYLNEQDKNEKTKNIISILGKGIAINRLSTNAISFCKIE